jgi:TonB-dependent receptor
MNKKQKILLVLFFFILMGNGSGLQAATIKGTVTEAKTREPLVGANVVVLGTSLGNATDFDGNYIIENIPLGKHTIRFSYIGYKQQEKTIEITDEKTIKVDCSLESDVIEGETVVVTAQRLGQLAAINQQITSDAIKNIVSADKIRELPEANAAEAVGRLPGVSLQREGGEGNKVVIRGMAPKYNKVQIDGVDMAATGSEDRSADMSMISTFLLDGIEVTKSAMANQNADQLGGTVNFKIKGATESEPTFSLLTEGGYNGLRREFNDYSISGQASTRMLDDQFGVSVTGDYERRNRSSNTVSAGYLYRPQDKYAEVSSLNVEDISRILNRFGGSLLLDYKTPTTNIVLSNMLSKIERISTTRNENSAGLASGGVGSSRNQTLTYTKSNTTILMNQLRLEQYIGDLKFDLGVSYSYSKENVPEELRYGGIQEGAILKTSIPPFTSPSQIPDFINNDISKIWLSSMYDSDSFTKEDEIGTHLNFEWQFMLSDWLNMKFETGGNYKYKTREYDYNTIYLNTYSDPSQIVNNAILKKWPYMSRYADAGKFYYEPFIDNSYNPGDFMAGEYRLERIPSLELGKELIHYLEDELGVLWNGTASAPTQFVPNFPDSKRNDYKGKEEYAAWYFMPTVTIGDQITFIPGVRYEYNKTEYTGVRANGSKLPSSLGLDYHEKTVTRKDEFFLPMIHAKIKPLDWCDVRASYTQTLARPSYTEFLPSWFITAQPLSIDYRNPDLRTSKSENYDLYFSFYGNKIGLFTVGLFWKNIDDLIFATSQTIFNDSMAVNDFGLTQEETGLPASAFNQKVISSFINNPNKAKVKGIELEWQSNLWYLPGFLNKIVFGINYTYTQSDVIYPRLVPIKKFVPQPPFGTILKIVGNADSSYTAPLLYQPKHILNITLGYDYQGFSIRTSMQFKARILSQVDWQPDLRGYTGDFYLYDLAVSQKLPIKGLEIFGNLKNISKTMETDHNSGTGFISNIEYYGMSGSVGIKYQL